MREALWPSFSNGLFFAYDGDLSITGNASTEFKAQFVAQNVFLSGTTNTWVFKDPDVYVVPAVMDLQQ